MVFEAPLKLTSHTAARCTARGSSVDDVCATSLHSLAELSALFDALGLDANTGTIIYLLKTSSAYSNFVLLGSSSKI